MKIYESVSITYYPNRIVEPKVFHYLNDGATEVKDHHMSVEEANLLMWKLVKLGGKNHYESNMFNNGISMRYVCYFG
jgi:hypothetical protein